MREVRRQKKGFADSIGSFLDRGIGVFSPRLAYKRMAYREAIRIVGMSSYRGAETNRLRSSWLPGAGSPDNDLYRELALLRERSRDLNRNDGTASGITNTITTNVIGSGIRVQCAINHEILGISEDEAQVFQREAEHCWERWIPHASAEERMDFYEIQSLIDRQILENGEVLILPLMLDDPKRPYSLALDVIEADRLNTPSDKRADKNIRMGVKIGDRGQPISYFIKKTHPGDMYFRKEWRTDDYTEYPARNNSGRPNVIHLYFIQRPGQTRGIPFFAPVLTYFKDMADYMEAELVAARIAACFSIFVKKMDAAQAAISNTSRTNSASQRIQTMEPGTIEYLAPGEDIVSFNPNRPGQTFDPFINRILRVISSALGLSYEIVSKDFSKSTYSSARAGLLQAYKYFRVRQDWLSRKFNQVIWSMLIEEAYLRGDLDVPDFYARHDDWCRAKSISPGWEWVDPLDEVKAAKLAIDSGLSTLTDEAAARGKDIEEIIGARVREEVLIKKAEEKKK